MYAFGSRLQCPLITSRPEHGGVYVSLCIIYVYQWMGICIIISYGAIEPYTSGTCTSYYCYCKCLHFCYMCAETHKVILFINSNQSIKSYILHTHAPHTHTHTHTRTCTHTYLSIYVRMHEQYCHEHLPRDCTTWCEEKEGRHHVHAVICNQLSQWVQRARHALQITSWCELVIIQIIVKTTFL